MGIVDWIVVLLRRQYLKNRFSLRRFLLLFMAFHATAAVNGFVCQWLKNVVDPLVGPHG